MKTSLIFSVACLVFNVDAISVQKHACCSGSRDLIKGYAGDLGCKDTTSNRRGFGKISSRSKGQSVNQSKADN